LSGRSASTTAASISTLFADFPSEGFTPIPHDLLDWIAPVLTEAELRVLIYICRRTYGFGKRSDRISLCQFCEGPTSRSGPALDLGTGLSRQGVLNAIEGLEGKGVLGVIPGRGRSQINEYEIHLTQEAWDRIITLQITPREKVNTVDPLRRPSARRSPLNRTARNGAQKGLRLTSEKVNVAVKSRPEKVYAVDPQEKVNIQERGIQQKVGSAQNCPPPPQENHPSEEDDFEGRLERTTGQRLTDAERRKLGRALSSGHEYFTRALDTFSTESYWADLPKRNAAFFRYLQDVAVEESRQEYWDGAEVEADW
jgi:hypothetical protein